MHAIPLISLPYMANVKEFYMGKEGLKSVDFEIIKREIIRSGPDWGESLKRRPEPL